MNKSKSPLFDVQQVLSAVLLSMTILFSSTLLAQQLEKSNMYLQSRLFSSIVREDSVGILDIVTEQRNFSLLTRFVGAVTSAYINFELIPINEAKTFATIFECLNEQIEIDRFAYQRKDLMLYGTTDSSQSYDDFIAKLKEKRYFSSVSGHTYTDTNDVIQFQIFCSAQSNGETQLAFAFFQPA